MTINHIVQPVVSPVCSECYVVLKASDFLLESIPHEKYSLLGKRTMTQMSYWLEMYGSLETAVLGPHCSLLLSRGLLFSL